MNHSARMGIAQRGQCLTDVIEAGIQSKLAGLEQTLESLPLDEFHNQNKPSVDLHCIVYGGNVGVVERRLHRDLALKSLDLPLQCAVSRDNFHGLPALGETMLRLKNLPHAAGADDPRDLVITESFSNMETHLS